MSNHTTKMTQVSIEINGNLYFSQIWRGKTSEECTYGVDKKLRTSDKNILSKSISFFFNLDFY